MDDTELVPVEQETADLDAQIDALIRQATERLREQLAQVRRNSESAHDPAHSEGIAD
jgi:membrane protein YdbS with pleckstrin-like domain